MIKYFCDNCDKPLSVDNLLVTQCNAQECLAEHPETMGYIAEIFCPSCGAYAKDYWQAKVTFITELNAEMVKRAEGFKRKFFAEARKRHLKPVEVAR